MQMPAMLAALVPLLSYDRHAGADRQHVIPSYQASEYRLLGLEKAHEDEGHKLIGFTNISFSSRQGSAFRCGAGCGVSGLGGCTRKHPQRICPGEQAPARHRKVHRLLFETQPRVKRRMPVSNSRGVTSGLHLHGDLKLRNLDGLPPPQKLQVLFWGVLQSDLTIWGKRWGPKFGQCQYLALEGNACQTGWLAKSLIPSMQDCARAVAEHRRRVVTQTCHVHDEMLELARPMKDDMAAADVECSRQQVPPERAEEVTLARAFWGWMMFRRIILQEALNLRLARNKTRRRSLMV